jgi:SAM-dependent methyltransferase
MNAMPSSVIEGKNAEFWNEICGSAFARSLGITDDSPESLRRFDEAYLRFYPYLEQYVVREDLKDKRVLEMGLGYGTLGQLLASKGCRYHGLDIARNPVALMRYRFALMGLGGDHAVHVGSALAIPYKESTFDYVYSIGCLHHAGDLDRAISEVHRVLTKGGKAVIMLYNRHSFRRLVYMPIVRARDLVRSGFKSNSGLPGFSRWVRAWYDKNAQGDPAPHTDYVSRRQARRLFRRFTAVRIDCQNFDPLAFKGRLLVSRERLLGNLARVMGLDLYITAVK